MQINKIIKQRIDQHVTEHAGLYTEQELKKLIPIWYEQIKRDVLITINKS